MSVFGGSLGTANPAGGGTSVSFTSGDTVPSAGKIYLPVAWYGNVTLNTPTIGGLTWRVNKTQNSTSDSNLRCALCEADAPSGLASGTSFAAAFSGSADVRMAGAFYVTGAATGSDSTESPVGGGGNGTAYSASLTVTDLDIGVAVAHFDFSSGVAFTPAGTASEAFAELGSPEGPAMHVVYEIYGSSGAKTLGGSKAGGGQNFAYAASATKPDAGGGGGGVTVKQLAALGVG